MGSSDTDFEHWRQLRVAGELLSEPQASVDDLLHILDQLDKLLQMVEQSPGERMKEALIPSTRALVSGSLLEHPNMDVRVSVASCLCELTKITAPEQPYFDEEMRGVFRCIVSVLDNLPDISGRYFDKMGAILDNVAKVRACALMLDIDNELVVRLFEHFLNSVRDHHPENVLSLMADNMSIVLEEIEEVSPVILRTLFASVKNVGVLPAARKLGEKVIERSAVKLRPYINQTVAMLGDSLVDYSPLLTSIRDGKTNFFEHKDESASVQSNIVDTAQSTVPLDDATQVNTREEMVTEQAGNATQQTVVEGAVDQPVPSLTSKLDTNDSNVASKPDTTESVKPVVSETVHGGNVTEKGPEILVSVPKPLEESEVTNASLQSGSQEDSQTKIQIKKGARSKKKSSNQHEPPSIVPVLTTVNEGMVDQEMKSPKRARKKTPKAEENKPSVNTGSDVEPVKSPQSKPAKRSKKKVSGGDSMAKKPKLSGKKALESKTPKKDNKVTDTGDSEVKPSKRPAKKDNETDSDGKLLKPSVKRRPRSKVITKPREEDVANRNEDTDSDNTPLKQSVKTGLKVKVKTKPHEDVSNNEETESDNTPLKQAVRKGQRSKVIVTNPSEDFTNEETESDNTPLKQSENKGKEMDSDMKPVNLSENIDDEETDSDNIPLKLTAKRVNKSGSMVKSPSKIKDGKKQGRGKTIQKDQTKSLSEVVDGMDVSLKSVLKEATKGKEKEKSEGARSAGSKRKRSVTKKKVTKTIKYDASLADQKVKVWWPDDKMYYEGVVESYDSAEKKHKVLYLDGDTETLNLKKEKWELIEEYSTPVEEVAVAVAVAVAVEAKDADIIPEIAGSSEGENKANTKAVKPREKDDKKQTPKKVVYSRGRKGKKSKAKSGDGNVKEPKSVVAAEKQESEKERSTASQQIGSESEEKKQDVN